jgi:hypothetical protein
VFFDFFVGVAVLDLPGLVKPIKPID